MIAYIEGSVFQKYDDRVVILVNGIGYEIFLPVFTACQIASKLPGDSLSLNIYHHQNEHQAKPVLIGFVNEMDRDFFQYFISVETIGPLKAAKAFSASSGDIARAIENSDAKFLSGLKGIGPRLAQKIIASLHGKVARFALIKDEIPVEQMIVDTNAIAQQVMDVLTVQLGYRQQEARKMIADAVARKPDFSTPEELFEEVYKGQSRK
jgi:Holliday junction DNA helicase RuvA